MDLEYAAEQHVKAQNRLVADYEASRRLTAKHGATYYFSTLLFPPHIQRHVFGLYGFVRLADEIVDNPKAGQDPREALDQFRLDTVKAVQTGRSDISALNAFANTAMICGIPEEYPLEFLDAMFMDLTKTRYQNLTELQSYTFGSACVVGLMMCKVLGVTDQAGLSPACDLGFAMQLTNFLRDIGEDWRERRRIYIPLDDLDEFGYSQDELAAGVVNDNFKALMRFEIQRARISYAHADNGMKYIPEGCRRPVILARNLYSKILNKIEDNNYDVFSRRAKTSRFEKAYELAKVQMMII